MKKTFTLFVVVMFAIGQGYSLAPDEYVTPLFEETGLNGAVYTSYDNHRGDSLNIGVPAIKVPLYGGQFVYQGSLNLHDAQRGDPGGVQKIFFGKRINKHTIYTGFGHGYREGDFSVSGVDESCDGIRGSDGSCSESTILYETEISRTRENILFGSLSGAWNYKAQSHLIYTLNYNHSLKGGFYFRENYEVNSDLTGNGAGTSKFYDYSGNSYLLNLYSGVGYWRQFGKENYSRSYFINFFYGFTRDHVEAIPDPSLNTLYTASENAVPITLQFPGQDIRTHKYGVEFSLGDAFPDRAPESRQYSKWLKRLIIMPKSSISLYGSSSESYLYDINKWNVDEGFEWGVTERTGNSFKLNIEFESQIRMYLFKKFFIGNDVQGHVYEMWLKESQFYFLNIHENLNMGLRHVIGGRWLIEGGKTLLHSEFLGQQYGRKYGSVNTSNQPGAYFIKIGWVGKALTE